jgi:hypothetical protein
MRRWVAAALLAGLLVGCGGAQDGGVKPGGGDRLHQQAWEALDRWDKAVEAAGNGPRFVPVGEQTTQIGDWEEAVGGNNKAALNDGLVEAAVALPGGSHPTTTVRWADGTEIPVRTISAEAALQYLVRTSSSGQHRCKECTPLKVISVRAVTASQQTSRGPATVPAWEYELEGTKVTFTRPAVDPAAVVSVTPPPWDPVNSPGGIWIESASTRVGSLDLMVGFVGSPDTADKPCGADYTAEAVESDSAVVVIVYEYRHAANETCAAIGASRTATARLAKPLGERTVLEVVQGLPVATTIGG